MKKGSVVSYAIKVEGLSKEFGTLKAVNKISFAVNEGEIFGLLGPNGAGKTTTIKMLTTILKPTAGSARVNGFDIKRESSDVRKAIGIVFQDPSLDEELTGRENLEFHAILYKIGKEERVKRIAEVLKLVELEDKADVLVKHYSGGMRRRLEMGRGLMHEPKILFLDEPTIGLDPQTRRHIWDYIKKLNEDKKTTIILTTHYIEEADYLCNRVAFIDHGSIVALNTPYALKNSIGGDVISLHAGQYAEKLEGIVKKEKWIKTVSRHDSIVTVTTEEGEKHIPSIVMLSHKQGINLGAVNLHKPSLEDAFIHFTGKSIRDEEGNWKDRMRAIRMSRGR